MKKEDLLKLAADVRESWEAAIEALSIEGLERLGVTEEWRVRDVLAHCNGYDRWQLVQMSSAFSGETPTEEALNGGIQYPPNDNFHEDAMNAMFIAGTRNLPTAEILRHWREITAMRIDWLSAATQEQLDTVIAADWGSGTNRIMRLMSEVPGAANPLPAWKLIYEQLEHQEMHLEVVKRWMEDIQ